MAQCEFCKKYVDAMAYGTFRFVSGWEENRRAGGTHAISLPQRQDRFAHAHCIDKERRGLTNQGGLF